MVTPTLHVLRFVATKIFCGVDCVGFRWIDASCPATAFTSVKPCSTSVERVQILHLRDLFLPAASDGRGEPLLPWGCCCERTPLQTIPDSGTVFLSGLFSHLPGFPSERDSPLR